MHELGIVFEIKKQVEEVAKENDIDQVEAVVVEVGEISTVIPRFLKECYPAAIENSVLENSELIIEIIKAVALCKDCKKEYDVMGNRHICPLCKGINTELLTGREFNIKEIRVLE